MRLVLVRYLILNANFVLYFYLNMSSCGVCNQPCVQDDNEPIIKCSGSCEASFHSRCIKDDLEGKKTRSRRDWKCKDCRNPSSAHSSMNSATTSTLTKDFLVRVLEDFKSEVFSELKNFRSEVSDLASAVKFMSDKMDESTQLIKDVKTELAAVKKDNNELRINNDYLTAEVSTLRVKVRSLEQYSRKNNVEIGGIPVSARENVTDIVKDVGAALGVEIKEDAISAAHRVPSFKKERTPSLIVQFVSRVTRDNLISKFRDSKGLTANQVNSTFPRQNIYVNEHMSPDNKVFLSHLKSKCKEVGYTYAWCRDGKFFARKSQGDKYIRVDTYEDMNKLK